MNYYKILGVQKTASVDDIKMAYRELAKKYHPDKNPKEIDRFKKINEAYNTLSNVDLKRQYDLKSNQIRTKTRVGDNVDDEHYKKAMEGYDHAMGELSRLFCNDPFMASLCSGNSRQQPIFIGGFNEIPTTININAPPNATVNTTTETIITRGKPKTKHQQQFQQQKPKQSAPAMNSNNNDLINAFVKSAINDNNKRKMSEQAKTKPTKAT